MVTVLELLTSVDDLAELECGALLVNAGGAPVGSVLAERRRVCWAVATRHGGRLKDLLRRYCAIKLSDVDLENLVLACRAEGKPFGEALVDRGYCSEEAMRAALEQHTIESLIALCSPETGRVSWVSHRQGSYRPAFTMAPIKLLAGVGVQQEGTEDLEAAELGLMEIAPEGAAAASFVIAQNGPVLVHAEHADELGLRAIGMLGSWVGAAFQACEGFSQRVLAHGIEHANGAIALGWRSSRRVLHAAVIEDHGAALKACAALEHRGHPAVFSTHKTTISVRRGELGAMNVNG